MEQQRDSWGSKFGFIMAAAGSAVGLGNIWRFPYLAGTNGGGAFVLIYLFFVIIVGLSIMIAEYTLGRAKSRAAVGAYKAVSPRWTFAGFMGVLTALLIMGFYPVVGGWATAYIFKPFSGLLASPDVAEGFFGAFTTKSVEPIIWTIIYLALNITVVAGGVSGGIEKAGKVLMPLLFVLLIVVAINGLMLPGAMDGLNFLLKPDFSLVTGSTFLAALGQAFFSLSLGMGCMITYGSFLSKDENIKGNALLVTITDTAIALIAGIAMFPSIFAYGLEPAAGPGLIFIVMPTIFAHMGGALGTVMHLLFFIAFTAAALTSSVSLMEVVVDYFIEQHEMTRKKALTITSIIIVILSILSSLSMGVMADFTILGAGFFDLLDLLTDKVYMAIGGLFLAITVGYFMDEEEVKNELTNNGAIPFGLYNVWRFLLRYVIPILIAIVSVTGIIAVEQTGLMIAGLISIVIMAVLSPKMR